MFNCLLGAYKNSGIYRMPTARVEFYVAKTTLYSIAIGRKTSKNNVSPLPPTNIFCDEIFAIKYKSLRSPKKKKKKALHD